MTRTTRLGSLLACVLAGSCSGGSSSSPEPDGGLDQIPDGGSLGDVDGGLSISPSGDFKLAVGGEIDLVARVYDSIGGIVVNSAVNPVFVDWMSSDATVVTIDEEGVVRGIKLGTVTVTGTVRGSTTTVSVKISVEAADMAAIFLDPSRLVLDVGATRDLKVTAVDSAGAPTTLDCGSKGVVLGSNTEVLTASYDGKLGAERIVLKGVKKGLTVLTLDCNGYQASPVVIEVKPPVTIPAPSGSTNFGNEPSMAVKGDQIHIAFFDEGNNKLVYTHFQGIWSSEVLDGEGGYGKRSQVVTDPLNKDRPVVCALEGNGLSCWFLESGGFWRKAVMAANVQGHPVRLAVNSSGVMYLAYKTGNALVLGRSSAKARDDWTTSQVAAQDTPFFDMVLGPDGLPLFVLQLEGKAYFGSMNSDGKVRYEVLDATSGTPPTGTGIRLAIGPDNKPQAVYYKNGNLIHALRNNGKWSVAVIATVNTTTPYLFGWGVTHYSQPRAAFFDATKNTLQHGVRLRGTRLNATNHWRIERPSARTSIGNHNVLVVDHLDRSQIVFKDVRTNEVGYYIDPLPLNYTQVDSGDVQPTSNTQVLSCPAACPTAPANSTVTCSVNCDFICDAGFHRCDRKCLSDDSVDSCGTSCSRCPLPAGAASAACVDKTCVVGTCASGYHLCSGQCLSNNLVSSCGSSCSPCPVPENATSAACTNQTCVAGYCKGGYHLCSGQCLSNDSVNTCGNLCSPCPTPTNALSAACFDKKTCVAGSCATGFHLCSGQCLSDDDVNSCGSSCVRCPAPPNAMVAACINKTCVAGSCATGFHLCSGQCLSNKALDSCGSSCSPCQPPANATAICDGTSCGFYCAPGYLKCGSQCCLAKAVSAGGSSTCAITSAGGAKCWGSAAASGSGIQGTGNTPIDIFGWTTGVSAISVGARHGCAVMATGGVKCWGANEFGQLGNGSTSTVQVYLPVEVLKLGGVSVSAVSVGAFGHTCALTSAGGAKCWGRNMEGQLGIGSPSGGEPSPVDVSGLTSGVSAIGAGIQHSCAVSNGGVKCWGKNLYGQLGTGTTRDSQAPVNVLGLTSGVSAIAVGNHYTCALTSAGGVKCWGYNNYGQLGNVIAGLSNSPVDVTGLTSGVSSISAGESHTCAVTVTGGVKCWGKNQYGELGDGTTGHRSVPGNVLGLTSGVSAVGAGAYHSCALASAGGIKCWGSGDAGQLGNGTNTQSTTPVDVSGL